VIGGLFPPIVWVEVIVDRDIQGQAKNGSEIAGVTTQRSFPLCCIWSFSFVFFFCFLGVIGGKPPIAVYKGEFFPLCTGREKASLPVVFYPDSFCF